MRFLLPIFALLTVALSLGACSTIDKVFGVGGVIENASPAEQPALRVIAASLTVKGAYETIENQFDAGLLSPSEAIMVKAQVDKAAEAVVLASTAIEKGGGDSELKLANEAIKAFLLSELFQEIVQ